MGSSVPRLMHRRQRVRWVATGHSRPPTGSRGDPPAVLGGWLLGWSGPEAKAWFRCRSSVKSLGGRSPVSNRSLLWRDRDFPRAKPDRRVSGGRGEVGDVPWILSRSYVSAI